MENKDFEKVNKYMIGAEQPCGEYAHIQNENIEQEVSSKNINLKSFVPKKELFPKMWKNETLDSAVRLKLMDIATDFWKTVGIGWVKPKTVILVGSITNYNWSKYSDVDLHIVVDFNKIHKNKDFVQEYFNEKKNSWNESHDDLTIYNHNIELYVQDVDADVESSAIYDLYKNNWIEKPNITSISDKGLNKTFIKTKSARIINKIDDLCDSYDNNIDNVVQQRKILAKTESLLKNIKKMRSDALEDGEMSMGNIIYKVIRRSEYLDKLYDLLNKLYNSINSIN